MEASILLAMYDNRWLLFGLPERLGLFDAHKDIKISNLCYFMAYIQVQLLAGAIYTYTNNNDVPFSALIDSLVLSDTAATVDTTKGLQTIDQVAIDSKFVTFDFLGWQVKEVSLVMYIHIAKIIISFVMGIQARYQEQKWF